VQAFAQARQVVAPRPRAVVAQGAAAAEADVRSSLDAAVRGARGVSDFGHRYQSAVDAARTTRAGADGQGPRNPRSPPAEGAPPVPAGDGIARFREGSGTRSRRRGCDRRDAANTPGCAGRRPRYRSRCRGPGAGSPAHAGRCARGGARSPCLRSSACCRGRGRSSACRRLRSAPRDPPGPARRVRVAMGVGRHHDTRRDI